MPHSVNQLTLPTIVKDANVLIEYLSADPLELTATQQHFKFRDLHQLNELLTHQSRLVDPKPRTPQYRYGAIHFLYLLLLAGDLTYIRFKGQRAFLEATDRLPAFRSLPPMGQYLTLLEICWTRLDWSDAAYTFVLHAPDLRHFEQTLLFLSKKTAGSVVSIGFDSHCELRPILWTEFWSYLSFMGFWDTMEENNGRDENRVTAITITEFGAWLIPTLAEERTLNNWNQPLNRFPDSNSPPLTQYPSLYRLMQDMLDQIETWNADQGNDTGAVQLMRERLIPQTDVNFEANVPKTKIREPEEAFLDAFAPLFAPEPLPEVLAELSELPEPAVGGENGVEEIAASGSVYTFKVKMLHMESTVWRRIEISSTATLYSLHKAILKSVGFDDDHLYAFFMDNKPYSNNSYTSPREPESPSVKSVKIGSLGLKQGRKILYIFDYGDNWNFEVLLESIDKKAKVPVKPRIVETFGDAPPQYEASNDEQ